MFQSRTSREFLSRPPPRAPRQPPPLDRNPHTTMDGTPMTTTAWLEKAHYGTPDYEDDKPEPNRRCGQIIRDRENVPWTRFMDGWIVAGDSRVQLWGEVQKWFDVEAL